MSRRTPSLVRLARIPFADAKVAVVTKEQFELAGNKKISGSIATAISCPMDEKELLRRSKRYSVLEHIYHKFSGNSSCHAFHSGSANRVGLAFWYASMISGQLQDKYSDSLAHRLYRDCGIFSPALRKILERLPDPSTGSDFRLLGCERA